jgi:hypothetical protein
MVRKDAQDIPSVKEFRLYLIASIGDVNKDHLVAGKIIIIHFAAAYIWCTICTI